MNRSGPEVWSRLLQALAELAAEEALQVEAEDTTALSATQARMAPVVEHLVASAGTADQTARTKLAEIVALRRHTGEVLARRTARMAEELGSTRRHQRQLAKVAPAYRQAVPATTRLAQTV